MNSGAITCSSATTRGASHHELWVHAIGCRKFFNITRHTANYEILETYRMGEQPTITAESLARGEKAGNVQVAEGGQQTVGASDAAAPAAVDNSATIKGAQA